MSESSLFFCWCYAFLSFNFIVRKLVPPPMPSVWNTHVYNFLKNIYVFINWLHALKLSISNCLFFPTFVLIVIAFSSLLVLWLFFVYTRLCIFEHGIVLLVSPSWYCSITLPFFFILSLCVIVKDYPVFHIYTSFEITYSKFVSDFLMLFQSADGGGCCCKFPHICTVTVIALYSLHLFLIWVMTYFIQLSGWQEWGRRVQHGTTFSVDDEREE